MSRRHKKEDFTCKCCSISWETSAARMVHLLGRSRQQDLFPPPPPPPPLTPTVKSAEEIQNDVFADTFLGREPSGGIQGQASPLWTSRQAAQVDPDQINPSSPSALDRDPCDVDAAVSRLVNSMSRPIREPLPTVASLSALRRLPNGTVKSPIPRVKHATTQALRILKNIGIAIADTQKYLSNAKTPEDVALAQIQTTHIGRCLQQVKLKSEEVLVRKTKISEKYQQLQGQCEEELLKRPMVDPIPVDAGECQNSLKRTYYELFAHRKVHESSYRKLQPSRSSRNHPDGSLQRHPSYWPTWLQLHWLNGIAPARHVYCTQAHSLSKSDTRTIANGHQCCVEALQYGWEDHHLRTLSTV